jgi:hypothetical protein
MGEDPDRIRAEIEQTRAEMRETVDALGHKADVKARAKESFEDKKSSAKESVVGATQSVKDKLVGAKDSVSGTAGDATSRVGDVTPDREQVVTQARRAKGLAQENPIGLAVGSLAIGFLAGLLVPATRVEDEKLGEVSDQVTEKVKETGQDALEHGKQVAQDAMQTAQEGAQQHGREVQQTARENMRAATS